MCPVPDLTTDGALLKALTRAAVDCPPPLGLEAGNVTFLGGIVRSRSKMLVVPVLLGGTGISPPRYTFISGGLETSSLLSEELEFRGAGEYDISGLYCMGESLTGTL
jgi:hypothetical protein